MRVLDLFSGLGGWSAAFKQNGHEVVTVDIDGRFKPTIRADIGRLTAQQLPGPWHVILASPPCRAFSVLSFAKYWRHGLPKTPETVKAIMLVKHTLRLIYDLHPQFWAMENPRGMLRKAIGWPVAWVTYCQYGTPYMKPTDLWGQLPPSFFPKNCRPGAKCHEATPRNDWGPMQKGLRGHSKKNAALAAKIPWGLSLAMCRAAEKDLALPALQSV